MKLLSYTILFLALGNAGLTRLAIVGAVQLATHIAVQYLILLDIVVRKGIPLTYMMSI